MIGGRGLRRFYFINNAQYMFFTAEFHRVHAEFHRVFLGHLRCQEASEVAFAEGWPLLVIKSITLDLSKILLEHYLQPP